MEAVVISFWLLRKLIQSRGGPQPIQRLMTRAGLLDFATRLSVAPTFKAPAVKSICALNIGVYARLVIACLYGVIHAFAHDLPAQCLIRFV
jgi:hypothetical protein